MTPVTAPTLAALAVAVERGLTPRERPVYTLELADLMERDGGFDVHYLARDAA